MGPPGQKKHGRRAETEDGPAVAPGEDDDLAMDCETIEHGRGRFLGEPVRVAHKESNNMRLFGDPFSGEDQF